VASALPGGDPLAAALAAGETPSPELVAEAGKAGGLSAPVAWSCLAATALGLALVILFSEKFQFVRMVSLPKPPQVLAEKAREVIVKLGYTNPPRDDAFGFNFDADYLEYIRKHDLSPTRWDRLKVGPPDALTYWYRQSPRYLVPFNDVRIRPTFGDPPSLVSGMVGVVLGPDGRLRHLEAVPPERQDPEGASPDPDWSLLFEAAGLDPAGFRPVEPVWSPPAYADRRAAWEGVFPGEMVATVRIEAAAYRGRPVSFRIVQPWTRPSGEDAAPEAAEKSSQVIVIMVILVVLLGGLLIARRNVRLGRGDRKGASMLALFVLAAGMAQWVISATHVPEGSELDRLFISLSFRLCLAAMVWVFYLALEPYLRRIWPEMIVSWVRLLDGRFRDPLVGRDVLIGLFAGVAIMLVGHLFWAGARWMGVPPPRPDRLGGPPLETQLILLRGVRNSIGGLFGQMAASLAIPMAFTILLLLLRLLLRKQSLAIAGIFVVSALINLTAADNPYLAIGFSWFLGSMYLFLLFRFGLLATVIAEYVVDLALSFPLTLDFSAWYSGSTVVVLVALAGMATYGLSVARVGRPAFRSPLLQD
jgi:serine/threonine-protein kinase